MLGVVGWGLGLVVVGWQLLVDGYGLMVAAVAAVVGRCRYWSPDQQYF